jgi:hypothetical protein
MRLRHLATAAALLACTAAGSQAGLPTAGARRSYPGEALAATPAPQPRDLQLALDDPGVLLLKSGVFDPLRQDAPDFPWCVTARETPGSADPLLVQFRADLTAPEKEALARSGIRILDRLPNRAYVLRTSAERLERLKRDPGVRWMDRLRGPYKVDPLLLAPGWREPVYLNVRLFPGQDPYALLPAVQALLPSPVRASVLNEPPDGQTLRVLVGPEHLRPLLERVSEDPSVWSIEPWFLPEPCNDESVWVIQSYDTDNRSDYALSATLWAHGITGTGQVVCVNDSGLDSDACYFRYGPDPGEVANAQSPSLPSPGSLDPSKKVIGYAVLPGAEPYDGFAFFGHGTHTTGSVAGDNYATPATPFSGGHDLGDGMAPGAKLFFQDSGNESSGILAGLTSAYALIFQQAREAGARIHSDSWGSQTAGAYTADCSDVDRFLWLNEDFQIFFANGNSGPGQGTVLSPAAAKNCVAVGALTNGSAGADEVAVFSSRGPTRDGRLKPDVCAPGQDVNSALADSDHGSAQCLGVTMSGTSMATPTAAGGAALLRQYFTDGFYPSGAPGAADAILPSGALLKAALVAGAMDVGEADGPNRAEGFGRVHLDNVCFFSFPVRDARRTRVWDRWNAAGLASGQREEIPLQVGPSQPLKVALAWTDPEPSPLSAVGLVNDLDLSLRAPDGTVYYGNVFAGGASAPSGSPDRLNTVEAVYLPRPLPGLWTLQVVAASVPGNPVAPGSDRQGFALVATYADCESTLVDSPLDLSASDDGTTGILLSWEEVVGAAGYQVYRAAGACDAALGEFHYAGRTAGTAWTDTAVQGGYAYAYVVRAVDGCSEGPPSACAGAAYSGNCTLAPVFEGLRQAVAVPSSEACAVSLTWEPAEPLCPSAPSLVYNVYRGTSPYFTPSADNRIATGLAGLSYEDREVGSLVTYYYVVRAEDGTASNGGPARGGNEEGNRAWRSATPSGPDYEPGTWSDSAGDEQALLTLDAPWTVTGLDGRGDASLLCYRSAPDGQSYPANRCASATTPPVPLLGSAPELTYWARYNIEQFWDGVVVEVSADGGATWSASSPSGGYPGEFSLTGSPPINACAFPAQQPCFTGPPGNSAPTEWAQYRHDLAAYAGRTVRVRWRLSTDPGAEFEGFSLDDIRITDASAPGGCEGHVDQPPQVSLTAPAAGDTIHGVVHLTAEAADDKAVAEVHFLADGAVVAALQAPPWEAEWDTSGQNASASLVVRARDSLGQTTTAEPVPVTVQNPTASQVKKLTGPFRLAVTGSGFQAGCQVLVGESPAPKTARKSATKAAAQGGATLKDMLPQGVSVPVVVLNPDGGRTGPIWVTR